MRRDPNAELSRPAVVPPTQDILPAGLHDRIHALGDPERRLRLAVLEDAIRYFQRYGESTDGRGRTLYEDAVDWFGSCDRTEPFAFENVCEALRLDAQGIRQRLRRWRHARDLRRHLQAA